MNYVKKLNRNNFPFKMAIDLASKYHAGQVDAGGRSYMYHLEEVSKSISRWYQSLCDKNIIDPESEETKKLYQNAKTVAYLHDILEDTDCTTTVLHDEGFSEEIIDAVVAITRRKDEQFYFDFIERVNKNPIAKIVKICDLENNMDIRRLTKFGDYEMKRLKKYWYSWKFLKGEISATEANNAIHPNRLRA